MSRTSRSLGRRVLVLPAVLAVVAVWQATEPAGGGSAQAQGLLTPAPEARLVLSFAFYGSTPTLSWSPSGDRLAFNAAYEYYGYETQEAAHRESLGLWVYERGTEAAHRLVAEQRYHPAWLGDTQVASGCSPYETCAEGLFVTGLDGRETRVLDSGVYHTLAANAEQVLYYNGFPGYARWSRVDAAPPTPATPETGLSSRCSWEPPPGLFLDQCVQTVGDVAVDVDAGTGLWARYPGGVAFLIDATPPYSFSSSTWDCSEDHSGPVAPCLSPDGRQVAYVAQGPGSLLLRVHELPTAAEVAAAPLGSHLATSVPPSGLFEASSPGATAVPAPPTWTPLRAGSTPAVDREPSRPYLGFDFYGDTPSLAWSPDGRRLVFNAAFEASAGRGEWDLGYAAIVGELGVYVVDREAGTVGQLLTGERYHPAWVGDDTVASACWNWESCTPGVVLTDTTGASRPVLGPEVSSFGVASEEQILYYDASVGSWGRLDVPSGATETVLSASCPAVPPRDLAQDQCLQEVGEVRVWAQAGTGLYVQVGAAAPIRLDPSPPWFYEGAFEWTCPGVDLNGPIAPCLSPDGQSVAYITRGPLGPSLHLHEIPR